MIENDFMLPLRFKTLSNFKKVDDESVEESLCKNIKKDFKDLSAEGYNSLTHSLSILPEALEAFWMKGRSTT